MSLNPEHALTHFQSNRLWPLQQWLQLRFPRAQLSPMSRSALYHFNLQQTCAERAAGQARGEGGGRGPGCSQPEAAREPAGSSCHRRGPEPAGRADHQHQGEAPREAGVCRAACWRVLLEAVCLTCPARRVGDLSCWCMGDEVRVGRATAVWCMHPNLLRHVWMPGAHLHPGRVYHRAVHGCRGEHGSLVP
jgi:hypothetical protein